MISSTGVVTSIKSIDLNAAVYRNSVILSYRINSYLYKLSEFTGAKWSGDVVTSDQISGRILNLVIPKGSMSRAQEIVIEAARARARTLNPSVDIIVTPF